MVQGIRARSKVIVRGGLGHWASIVIMAGAVLLLGQTAGGAATEAQRIEAMEAELRELRGEVSGMIMLGVAALYQQGEYGTRRRQQPALPGVPGPVA